MSARLTADRAVCVGSGQCVFTDPDMFDQDDDGKVIVLRSAIGAADAASAAEAVQICPSRALALVQDDAGS